MYQYHTLPNGIKLVFSQSNSAVAYSGVYVNVGSRDEEGPMEGMAHFIEHSIFKGTTHRKSYHIQSRIDGVGGELNAYTTKEETCIYATALNIHLGRCLELFSDLLFNSTFPQNEIDKEKEVVIEEINSYKDYPAELIYDEFEELAYGDHPIAHNILGNKKNVRHFNNPQIKEFFDSHYTTDKMVISVVANIEFKKLIHLCEQYFGAYPLRASQSTRSVAPVYTPFTKTVNRHTHQVHALIGCAAPNIYDERKVAFSLLNNIIGGPAMNSRLNVAIREKYGFCYTIESQYTPFTDAGLFYIYAGLDADAQDKATELILAEMKVLSRIPLTPSQLHNAQQQYIGQMTINNDSGLNEMQSIGKAYLTFDHVDSMEDMARDIMNVTIDDIKSLAQETFRSDNISFLYYK